MSDKISTMLWFNDNAEEAVRYYCSVLKNAKVTRVNRHNGKALVVAFEIDGQRFEALNGGPHYQLTEAASIVVRCDDQAEVDELWTKLSDGGAQQPCGWVKDKFGLSWQVVPRAFLRLLEDPTKAAKAMNAMMTMKKLDIAELERAAAA